MIEFLHFFFPFSFFLWLLFLTFVYMCVCVIGGCCGNYPVGWYV